MSWKSLFCLGRASLTLDLDLVPPSESILCSRVGE
jgi:hypothetical protein